LSKQRVIQNLKPTTGFKLNGSTLIIDSIKEEEALLNSCDRESSPVF
jgi:hypothetical protein